MQRSSPPVWGPLLMALLAAVSALAYVTGSVEITRSVITWPVERTGASAPMVLSAQSPESLRAQGPCTADGLLLETGEPAAASLTVRSQQGRVWMTYQGRVVGETLSSPTGCSFTFEYLRSTNVATLEVGQTRTEAAVEPVITGYDPRAHRPFAVTRLGAAPGVSAVLVTQPTTFHSSGLRVVWLLLSAAALIGLAGGLRQRYPARPRRHRPRRWSATDGVVAVSATVAMVMVPPRFDDGWVLTTVRQYEELGFFSNYYSVEAVPQPQGFWWAWIERLWLDSMETPAFLLRLPTALLLIGTWWLLRRQVLDRLGVGPSAAWTGCLIAVAGAVGLQMTLRPEPVIALLLAAALSVVVRYHETGEPWLLVVLAALCAAALAEHQTGWAVVAAALAVTPRTIGWLRETRAYVAVLAVVVAALSMFLILATLGSNWTLWWNALASFRSDTSTYSGLLNEGRRIGLISDNWDVPSITFVAGALLVMGMLGFLIRGERRDSARTAVGWAAMAAIVGLSLTSSKLIDHIGAVVPAGVILAALAVEAASRRVVVAAAVVVGAVLVVATDSAGVWALGQERSGVFTLGAWRLVALLTLSAWLVMVVLLLVRGRVSPPAGLCASVSGLVVMAVLVSVIPVLGEAGRQGSWLGQQIGALAGRPCGLLGVTPMAAVPASVFSEPETSEGFASVPLPPGASAWVRGSLFASISMDVVAADGSVDRVDLPPSSQVWAKVPAGTDAVALEWADPALTVVVASATSQSALEVHAASPSTWWVNPGLALQAPCVRSASIRTGYLPQVRHSVGTPQWMGSGLLDNAAQAYETGCVDPALSGPSRCLVELVPRDSAPLDSREVRETVS